MPQTRVSVFKSKAAGSAGFSLFLNQEKWSPILSKYTPSSRIHLPPSRPPNDCQAGTVLIELLDLAVLFDSHGGFYVSWNPGNSEIATLR